MQHTFRKYSHLSMRYFSNQVEEILFEFCYFLKTLEEKHFETNYFFLIENNKLFLFHYSARIARVWTLPLRSLGNNPSTFSERKDGHFLFIKQVLIFRSTCVYSGLWNILDLSLIGKVIGLVDGKHLSSIQRTGV